MNSHALIANSLETSNAGVPKETAPVSGFARSFLTYKPIANAKITILENGAQFTTNEEGRFGPFQYPVGEDITLVLEKEGFHTTQSATITVPKEGLTDIFHEISFQVPSDFAFNLFLYGLGFKLDDNACQIAAAITAFQKTMEDIPQGEVGAQAVLTPNPQNLKPFYFGIFGHGPLKDKTSPFQRHWTASSADGGVGFVNLLPRDEPYTLTAVKDGKVFNTVKFIARKGAFINISPPHGPMVQHPDFDPANPGDAKMPYQPKEQNSKYDAIKKGGKYFGLFALAFAGSVVAVGAAEFVKNKCSPK